ncbi:MAG: hypothetical protein QW270_00230 [Candidatus Bathyarchaeia archaeon]
MSAIEKNNERGKLTKDEAKGLVEIYKYLLEAYGQFAETLGKIQQTHKEAYASMFSLDASARLPELLSEMSNRKPELSKLLTEIFVKMATLLPRLSNLMNLSANEKIKLGQNLKSLAKDFEQLLDWIEKVEDE